MSEIPKVEPGPGMPPDMTELAGHILAVAEARDQAAFEALFRYFAPRLKAFFLRSGAADGTAAEELAQDTMLVVWQKAALFDPHKAGAATWIFVIARNLRADARRRDRRTVVGADGSAEAISHIADSATAADQMMSLSQQEAVMRRALNMLPQEQMQVLEMSYFDDISQNEISRKLRVPLGTVKSRLRLALLRLRAALASDGRHEEKDD